MKKITELIEETERLLEDYRRRNLPIDAFAARVRLQALLDAKAAVETE